VGFELEQVRASSSGKGSIPFEIERKFLVDVAKLRADPTYDELDVDLITQGYISSSPVVRVRTVTSNLAQGAVTGFLTVKGFGYFSRPEYEYEIPAEDAFQLLHMAETKLTKTRHTIGRFVVDQFHHYLEGLWLAEIELSSEDEQFDKPAWLLEEVTFNPAYHNVNLARSNYLDGKLI
jgi:CYTH domain-containing protein